MKAINLLKFAMIFLACVGMILPASILQAAVKGEPSTHRTSAQDTPFVDVALRPGGVLLGQVLGSNGPPPEATPVSLRQAGRQLATAPTTPAGHFSFKGLRGGTYEITAARASGIFRVWDPNTAPPSARPGALVVSRGSRVRGAEGPLGHWLTCPLILTALVAAAVAIPVGIHNHRIHSPASQ